MSVVEEVTTEPRLSVRVTPDLRDRLVAEAEVQQRSTSSLVRLVVSGYLDDRPEGG